ncbi:MAG: hydroxymethylglutaryl-CoA lyase [Henriciella sp.]
MDRIKIMEVGPRDGLQNESGIVSTETKIELVNRLAGAGMTQIEAGSFVSPKWVPQMAGTDEVLAAVAPRQGVSFPVLVPNMRGYQSAKAAGAQVVAVFISASEAFSHRNINCSVSDSLLRCREVLQAATEDQIQVRGYLSNVLGCPYDGKVAASQVVKLTRELLDMGCYEVSLCDTIGVGTPPEARQLINDLKTEVGVDKLAGHFHDTYGQALANTHVWIEAGVRTFDTAVSGLGGCPFAKGASGNLSTEDFVYSLHGEGVDPAIDLDELIKTGAWISSQLNRSPDSRVAKARTSACA